MVDNPLACERHDATDDGLKVRCVSHDTLAASNRCYQCPHGNGVIVSCSQEALRRFTTGLDRRFSSSSDW